MKNNKRKSIPLPPINTILDLLNGVSNAETEIIKFYEGYIQMAATEPIYSEDGLYNGMLQNEDLMQEIRIALFKALPILRRNVLQKISDKKIVIVISIQNEKTE